MDVHPTKNVSIGIDPYPYSCAATRWKIVSKNNLSIFRMPMRINFSVWGKNFAHWWRICTGVVKQTRTCYDWMIFWGTSSWVLSLTIASWSLTFRNSFFAAKYCCSITTLSSGTVSWLSMSSVILIPSYKTICSIPLSWFMTPCFAWGSTPFLVGPIGLKSTKFCWLKHKLLA